MGKALRFPRLLLVCCAAQMLSGCALEDPTDDLPALGTVLSNNSDRTPTDATAASVSVPNSSVTPRNPHSPIESSAAAALIDRGCALVAEGDFAQGRRELVSALAHCDRADGWFSLSLACDRLGDDDRAVFAYRAVLVREPANEAALNNLAWLLATSDEPAIRDGAAALALLESRAPLDSLRDPQVLDTAASACAATGDFSRAVELARRAHRAAISDTKQTAFAEEIASRITLFDAGLPYRRAFVKVGTQTMRRRDLPIARELFLRLASEAAARGDHESAIEGWKRAIALTPYDSRAHSDLGLSLMAAGRYAEALASFQTALDCEPASLTGQNNLAWLLATCPEAGIRDGARSLRLVERICALNPGSSTFEDTRAAALAELGQFDRATSTLDRALEIAEADNNAAQLAPLRARRALYAAGSRYRQTAQPAHRTNATAQVLTDLVANLDDHPEWTASFAELASFLASSTTVACRDPEVALSLARALARVVPTHEAVRLALAKALAAQGAFSEAGKEVDRAIPFASDPGTRTTLLEHRNLFRSRQSTWDTRELPDNLKRFADGTPTSERRLALACGCAAQQQLAQHENELAESLFSAALRLNSALSPLRHQRARLRLERGAIDAASSDLYQAILFDGCNAQALVQLGTLLKYQGLDAAAVQAFQDALLLDPRQSEARIRLAWLLSTHPDERIRDGKSALRLAMPICESDPRPAYLDVLAAAHAECGDFERAATTIATALQLARQQENQELLAPLEARQQLYKRGEPFRAPKSRSGRTTAAIAVPTPRD